MAEQDATAQPAAAQPQPQSFDDVFKEPAAHSFDDIFKPRTASLIPEPPLSLDSDQWKTYLHEAPVGRIISAFGDAFTGPGFSEEATEKMRELGIFNPVSEAQQQHTDSFAQGIVRPIITTSRALAEGIARPFIGGLDTIQRAIEGAENVVAQAGQEGGALQLGQDIAGMIEEAATFGHIVPEGGVPALPKVIAEPRAGAVIGEGEHGYFDTKAPTDAELQARTAAAAQVAPEVTAETPAPATPAAQEAAEPAPAPTIHDIARQTDPDLFREYDALQARRDTFARWMRELPDQTRANIEANPPEALRTLDDQIAATERKLENAGARRRDDFQDQLDALHDQRADLVEDLMRNHPDVAQVRKALQDTDNRMRDLAPDVSAAYREAELRAPQTEEIGAAEAAVEPGNEPEPTAASATLLAEAAPSQAPVPETAEAPATPEAAPPEPARTVAGPATPEQLQQIADDVTQKLTAAGRPDEEARAAAQIVAAYYDTRAQRFGGKLGTAQEIYAREAPDVRAGRQRTRVPEMAQKPGIELDQSAYHGSPHIFDKFTLDHIGKGEGAQAFGHGLYFATKKAIAKFYREKLTGGDHGISTKDGTTLLRNGRPIQIAHGYYDAVMTLLRWAEKEGVKSSDELAEALERRYAGESWWQRTTGDGAVIAEVARKLLKNGDFQIGKNERGRLYHVDLAPKEDEWLDWDKPFAQQSPKVQAALKAIGLGDGDGNSMQIGWSGQKGAYKRELPETGKSVYEKLAERFSDRVQNQRAASEALLKAGIRGIRYLDNSSRGRGEGTHNFVVFDPNDITIKEYEQSRRGSITLPEGGRRVIKLFKDADASTFMHEMGHAWLEDLMADALRPEAPNILLHDATAVRKWLGAEGYETPITRAQHEKFARGFERYLMEGVAPSRQLAGVFAKFKDWLTRIYQTVARLKSPINDDIRDVFDRLLSRAPEKVTLAPEVERPSAMADIHEAEAEHTPPAEAEPVLDKQRTEFATDARARTPELVPELQLEPATEGGPGPAERPSPNGGEPAPGPEFGAAGGVQGPGAVGPSAGEAGAEGAPAPSEPAAGEPSGGAGPGGAAGESVQPPGTGTADPELIDKAGNIRLDNLNQPEDVDDALRQIAREQNNFEADRFGPEGRQLHDQILAARRLTAQAMQEMADARVKAAAENASEEDLMAYKDAADRLTLIARRLSVLTHNWGLAGQAFRSLNGIPESAKMLTMAQIAERTKGMTFNQLRQEAQLGMKFDTPAQQMKFINDLRASNWDKARSMVIEYFVNNLISGPITHMAYTVGNETANLFRAGVEGPIAAAISAVRGRGIGERIYAGEAKALLYSHTKGAVDGWAAAGKAWKTGISESLPGELEALSPAEREKFEARRVPNTGAIPGKVGEAIRLPSHGVAAIHSFGRAVGAAQELWRLAYRSASDAGLEGEAFDRHVAEFIQNPPAGTLEKVNEAATRGVLMQRAQYGTAFYHLKQLTEKNLAAKLIAPFMQIGANLLHEAFLERTPLGLINKDIRDNLMGRNGAIAQDMQTGKMVAGITLSTAVIGLTLNGLVSGGGPSDPKERRVLMATGWQPYSLKVGGRWVPFRKYMGPLGLLVAGAADVAEIGHQLQEGDMLKAAASFVGGFSEVVADESWFRGVSNFINAARNYDKPEAERYLRDLATDFIPYSVGLSQVARTVDPYSRQVRTLVDSVKAHTPGVSETLFPRRDILGEPIPSRLMTSPSAVRDEPVLDAMLKAEYYPSTLGRKIRGVELTDQQYDDFQRVAGRMAKVTIRSMVDQPDWNALPVNLRHRMIQDAFTHARERARSTVIAQSIGTDHDIAKAALSAKVKRLSDTE